MHGNHHAKQRLSLHLEYGYEEIQNTNWALDGIAPATHGRRHSVLCFTDADHPLEEPVAATCAALQLRAIAAQTLKYVLAACLPRVSRIAHCRQSRESVHRTRLPDRAGRVESVTTPVPAVAEWTFDPRSSPASRSLQVPRYLNTVYWWAYVHPRAVRIFERYWLVNLILFGNYKRLCNRVLADLGAPLRDRTLQIACVYGDLTLRLRAALAPDAHLEVVDILPIQLQNLRSKLPADDRVTLMRDDSASLAAADASFEQVLLFMLLHEQPESVRRATLSEALRVVKPGGKIVIVDYHRPARLHPLRPLMRSVFGSLEPYAMDLWRNEIEHFLPAEVRPASISKATFFGGLYQQLTLIR